MTTWMQHRTLGWLITLVLVLSGAVWLGNTPSGTASDTLVATVVEASDLHADGTLNDSHLLATSQVAAAQHPDAIMLDGDLTDHGYASEFTGLWGSGWGAFKPKILAAPGNHEEDSLNQAEFMSQFGYSTTYNTMDVHGVHLIALDVDITDSSPSMLPGGAQYEWLKADLAAHARHPILAMSHFPRYSAASTHGDTDSTEIRNEWNLLQQAGAEIVFAGHDHSYQRFPRADADGAVNPTAGLREIVGATGGSGDLYPTSLTGSALRPDYYEDTVEGVIRIRIYTDHLEWAHVGVDGVTRDLGTAPLSHPIGAPTPSPTVTPVNTAPVVHAGPNLTVRKTVAARLVGRVTDDGLPAGILRYRWSKVRGSGRVTWSARTSRRTSARFSQVGSYVLRLTASDGALAGSDRLTVKVIHP